MQKKIGNVVLDYSFYSGDDRYSDGDIEDTVLDAFRNGTSEQLLRSSNQWAVLYHLSDIRENILEWYPFNSDASLLEIGSGCGALTRLFSRKVNKVTCIELSEKRSFINAERNKEKENIEIKIGNFEDIKLEEKYDYITLIGVWEYAGLYVSSEQPYILMLEKIKQYLKPNGKIIIAIENKMGMKYLNGAKEDHVGKAFAGIEDYRDTSYVRTFSKPELCQLLERVGIEDYKFYYPSPDYKLPDSIYSDTYMPEVGEIRTWGKNYDHVRMALYNEAIVADQICRDHMFDYFSNSFLIICNEKKNDYEYIHYTNVRNEEYQTKTIIIEENGKRNVKKEYLKQESARPFDIFMQMNVGYEILGKEFKNIKFLKPLVDKNRMEYRYLDGVSLEAVLLPKIHLAEDLILAFRNIIHTYFAFDERYCSEFKVTDAYKEFFGDHHVTTKEKALEITNIDMVLQNMILQDDIAYCIDYEWVFDFPIPFEFVIYRCAEMYYGKYNMYFSKKYNFYKFMTAVGIKEENIAVYGKMADFFYQKISGKGSIGNYRKASGMLMIPDVKWQ